MSIRVLVTETILATMISVQMLLENAFEIYTDLNLIFLVFLYKQVYFPMNWKLHCYLKEGMNLI